MTKNKALVILGNGFDIAFQIPTMYSDFYQNSQDLKILANNGNSLCSHIIHNIKTGYWSDLEKGLYDYSCRITKQFGSDNNYQANKFETEFYELRDALFKYIDSVFDKQVDVEKYARPLGLVREWETLSPQFLTFNYSTNTFVDIFGNRRDGLNNDDTINQNKFIYQHGSIYDTQKCCNKTSADIVLGIDPTTQIVEPMHSFLYKSNQNVHNIRQTIQIIQSAKVYIVYGCSMGSSDATYFKELFGKLQYKKCFLIYHYGQDALSTIQSNLSSIGVDFLEFKGRNDIHLIDLKGTYDQDPRIITKRIISSL